MIKYILARCNRDVLKQASWSNLLLAFDYDGTLAPIKKDPARAVMRTRTHALLAQLAEVYPCIVISGRARADVGRFLAGVPLRVVVGNHGVEPWHAAERFMVEVQKWHAQLAVQLAGLQGVHIEDKVYSIAVHYRLSREKKRAREAILQAVAALGEVRVIGGKQVVNILPVGAPHKGVALLRAREMVGCDTALYIGDDETDEDVFGLRQPGQLLSVRVGRRLSSAASYFIYNQVEIDALLRTLLQLRSKAPSQHPRPRGSEP